ncbi:hypothetical protein [Tolypothrix sp. VBCCA 56010]|uniref:hypothetical protein n=1 Tax=Tolypothrix sp. VBCCA 56010 TaxID=3137731 RepID=UPI003D7EE944
MGTRDKGDKETRRQGDKETRETRGTIFFYYLCPITTFPIPNAQFPNKSKKLKLY